MITFAKWIAFFPSLAETPEAMFNLYMEVALIEMGTIESRWVVFYDLAQMYLLAHLITQANKFADGGGESANAPVSNRNVDDVRVVYAIAKQNLSDINTMLLTGFGQEYVRIRRKALAGPRVA